MNSNRAKPHMPIAKPVSAGVAPSERT